YLILVLLGEVDTWLKQIQRNPFLRGVSLTGLFALLQVYIARHYALQQQFGPPGGPGGPPGREASDAGDYEPDEVDLAVQARVESMLLTSDILGDWVNTLSIIESAGTASEYWGCRRLSLDGVKATIRGARLTLTPVPRMALEEALCRVGATTLDEFIPSYLAICELALFGPVMPQHRHLRRGRIRLYEIVPFLRWSELLNAASKTPPLTGLSDYERYTSAL